SSANGGGLCRPTEMTCSKACVNPPRESADLRVFRSAIFKRVFWMPLHGVYLRVVAHGWAVETARPVDRDPDARALLPSRTCRSLLHGEHAWLVTLAVVFEVNPGGVCPIGVTWGNSSGFSRLMTAVSA